MAAGAETGGETDRAAQATLLATALGSATVVGATVALHGPSLMLYAERFGIGIAEAGLIVAAQWGGAFLAVVTLMAGARLTARWALACLALGAGGIVLAPSWGVVLASAMVLGAGHGVSSAVFNARVLAEFGARGPSMLGLANALFGVGAIGAPLLLVGLGNSPQAVFTLLAVASALLWPFARPPAPGAGSAPVAGGVGALLGRGRKVMLLGGAAVGFEASLAGLGPAALIAAGTSLEAAALLTSGLFVTFVAGRLSLVWLAGRISPLRLVQTGLAGLALCMAGATVLPPGPFFVAAGGFAGILFPCYFVMGARLLGRTPRAGSVLVMAGMVGGVCLPAALAGLTGVLFGLLAAGALAALALLHWLAPGGADSLESG